MLIFSTYFKVEKIPQLPDILAVVKQMLLENKASQFTPELLDTFFESQETPLEIPNESLEVCFIQKDGYEGLGVKHFQRDVDENVEWITYVVGAKINGVDWISVQVTRNVDTYLPAVKIPTLKVPRIMRYITKKFDCIVDYEGMRVGIPVHLKEKDIYDASIVFQGMQGQSANVLPIVYVTVDHKNERIINHDKLAHRLLGLGHVYLEPNREFSAIVQEKIDNELLTPVGDIGIYWPGGEIVPISTQGKTSKALILEIEKSIRYTMIATCLKENCSWSYLKRIQRENRQNQLRTMARHSDEALHEYAVQFDRELAEYKEEASRLEREAESLRNQLEYYKGLAQGERAPVLQYGDEQDFFPGEIHSIVMTALEGLYEKTKDGSRPQLLLEDLILHNDRSNKKEEYLDELKNAFHGYTTMNHRIKSTLKQIGFELTEIGKHYKITLIGDLRSTATFSKTTSDSYRAGKNIYSQIKNQFFL